MVFYAQRRHQPEQAGDAFTGEFSAFQCPVLRMSSFLAHLHGDANRLAWRLQ